MDEFRGIMRKEMRDKKRRKRRKMRVNGRSVKSLLLPLANGKPKANEEADT